MKPMDEPIVAVDWKWYQKFLRSAKANALNTLRRDRGYLQKRVSSLQNVRDWDTSYLLDSINDSTLEIDRLTELVKSVPLSEMVPVGFWLPRCPTCDGSGLVTVVTERESSFDFSVGQDRETVVCPTCGLGAT